MKAECVAGLVALVLSVGVPWAFIWYLIGFKRGQIGALSSTRIFYSLDARKDGSKRWTHSGGLNLAKPFGKHDEPFTDRKHVVVSYEERKQPNYGH